MNASPAHPAGGTSTKSPISAAVPRNKHSDMFPAPQWRDVWAAVAFYLHFAAFLAISVYAYWMFAELPSSPSEPLNPNYPTASSVFTCMVISTITASLLTCLSLMAMRRSPEQMIHISLIGSVCITALVSVAILAAIPSAVGRIVTGVVFLVLAALQVGYYFLVRSRIPFSAIILRTVCECLNAYPSMLTASAGSVVVSIIYLSYWTATVVLLALVENSNSSGSSYPFLPLMFYSCFSMFWTMQVVGNVLQTTISGVYATYYFLHGTGQAIINPTMNALSRSLTFSFGSICLGSLIVAAIQTLQLLLRYASDRDSIAGCIAMCLLDIVEDLVRYFNYYAYTQIAIYGKSYIQASKDTWQLIKSRGIDAIINDDLIGTCISICVLSISLVSYLVALLVSLIFYPTHNHILESLISLATVIIPLVALKIIGTGATTIFVCLAEDPAALQRSKPDLFNAINARYSNISI